MDGENPSNATVTPSVDIRKCFQLFIDSNEQWKKPLKGCLGNILYEIMIPSDVIYGRHNTPL